MKKVLLLLLILVSCAQEPSVIWIEGITVLENIPSPSFVQNIKNGWYKITLDGACKIEASSSFCR